MQLPLLIFFQSKLKSRENLQQQVAEDSLPVEARQQHLSEDQSTYYTQPSAFHSQHQSENSPTA